MKEKRKKTWRRKLLLVSVILFAMASIWCGYNFYLIQRTIDEAAPRQADVGIVLGAAVWGDRPSPGLSERLNYALWLYNQGYVKVLLVSGGLGEGKKVTEAEAMRTYLLEKGVPADAILIEDKARSTYENLLFSQQVMEKAHLKNALIISHDYHLARAKKMADSLQLPATVAGVQSQVLYAPYHKMREVLALTVWELEQIWS